MLKVVILKVIQTIVSYYDDVFSIKYTYNALFLS